MSPWAELSEEVVLMLPFWPLVVVAAVAAALAVALLRGPRLFRGTVTVRRSFWCALRNQEVDVDFEESAWDARRLDVTRCTAFDPPSAVTCDKPCLRLPEFRHLRAA